MGVSVGIKLSTNSNCIDRRLQKRDFSELMRRITLINNFKFDEPTFISYIYLYVRKGFTLTL
jgi:hypothetical protein